MDFKDTYPDYVAIEEHIRRARIQRSLALAEFFATVALSVGRGFGRLVALGKPVARISAPRSEGRLILPKIPATR